MLLTAQGFSEGNNSPFNASDVSEFGRWQKRAFDLLLLTVRAPHIVYAFQKQVAMVNDTAQVVVHGLKLGVVTLEKQNTDVI